MRAASRMAVSALARMAAPHRASIARLTEMPLTVIGFGCIDFAAFHYVHMIGWAVTGISLLVAEHMIADPDEPGRM